MKKIKFHIIALLILLTVISVPVGVQATEISISNDDTFESLEGQVFIISPEEILIINKVRAITNSKVDINSDNSTLAWLYTLDVTTYQILDEDEDIPPTKYISRYIGFEDPDGNPYFASGTVSHVGTAYNFPSEGKKQAVYEGTLYCYIY